ncbi:hypothetical protein DDZ13_00520 [Coraliomargarita sinensis]|uniref:Entericidin n=1 Tax=Coraliomargarita sinensis TaxID=2174842 RepID=A0A317ZI36_9BACT|nr:entericidin A/B family lipoprotein [Coraliomargarita sinensis]PXA05384.1 hypothetical protein DDZ13_00520 [Coraliomargarita sinensis]
MKKYLTLLAALTAVLALMGCNTLDGVGEDLEDAGESMQEAAD